MRARQRRYSAKQQATAVAEVETQETENELDGLLKRSFRPRTNEALRSGSSGHRHAVRICQPGQGQGQPGCRIDH